MTIGIVDGFKAIKIHKHQRERASFAIGLADGLIEAILKQNTIG
ncbi:Uncharacterised protein [Enterobacter cloacae]|nr:Uncharacterised protein [Enterobacter cloacae]